MNVPTPVMVVVVLAAVAMTGTQAIAVMAPRVATKGAQGQLPTKGAQTPLPTTGHPAGGGKGTSTVNGTGMGPRR